MDLTSLALTAALLTTVRADAAPAARAPRAYAYASGYVAHHAANGPLYHRVRPALGGRGADVAFGAGAFVARNLAVEGEILRGGAITGAQHFSYFFYEDYVAHTHDVLISALARLGTRASVVHLVGGVGLARTTTQETATLYTDSFGLQKKLADSLPYSVHALGWTAGVDVRALSRPHCVLTPSLRIRLIDRDEEDPSDSTGIGRITWEAGLTIFVR